MESNLDLTNWENNSAQRAMHQSYVLEADVVLWQALSPWWITIRNRLRDHIVMHIWKDGFPFQNTTVIPSLPEMTHQINI